MIKENNKNTKKINMSYLQKCLKKAFKYPNCRLIKIKEDAFMLNYTANEWDGWTSATFIIKQPVIFMYGEFNNLLAYGTPEDQKDFESNFANTCYKILNEYLTL